MEASRQEAIDCYMYAESILLLKNKPLTNLPLRGALFDGGGDLRT